MDIGQRVALRTGARKRFGNVVEIGDGPQAGRVRVKWEYEQSAYEGGDTTRHPYTIRTWIAKGRLFLDPHEY